MHKQGVEMGLSDTFLCGLGRMCQQAKPVVVALTAMVRWAARGAEYGGIFERTKVMTYVVAAGAPTRQFLAAPVVLGVVSQGRPDLPVQVVFRNHFFGCRAVGPDSLENIASARVLILAIIPTVVLAG